MRMRRRWRGSGPARRLEVSLVASGFAPGEKVVWFGVESRMDDTLSEELARRHDVGVVAADGTARFALTNPASPRSVWMAVELKSGKLAAAAPDGSALRQPEKPPQLGAGEGALADEILDERPYLMGLVVRPGSGAASGAWAFAGGDGGPRDQDGENNGHLRFALDGFEPLAASPEAPAKVQAEDLWFIVDPLKMEISFHKGGIAQ
jgi:hypothetical protein